MPTYKITDPATGKTLRLTGDSPPSEQELNDIFSKVGGTSITEPDKQPVNRVTPFLPKEEEVSRLISGRKDSVDVLREEVQTPYNFRRKPLQSLAKSLVTGLKTVAVPFQRLESGAAGLGLGLQKGKISEGFKNAKEGLLGRKQQQLGDIIRTTGFGGELNEPISSTVGFFSSLKLADPLTKGKLVESAKKAEAVLSSKIPKIMDKNYVLKRAKLAEKGLDELYEGLSKEYDSVYEKIGKIQVNAQDVQSIIDDLPSEIISRISKSKLVTKTRNGELVPDMNNLKAIKSIIKKSVPDKIWSGKAIGDMNTAVLEQAYGKISGIMAKGNDDLMTLNKKYGDFMQMRKTISRVLYDADGNIQANNLSKLFSKSGERGKQIFFEEFAKQWPKAKEVISDVIKYNKRQGFKKGAGTLLKYGIGFEAGRRFIANPLMESIQKK